MRERSIDKISLRVLEKIKVFFFRTAISRVLLLIAPVPSITKVINSPKFNEPQVAFEGGRNFINL
jgi:hypothetical protein